MTPAPASGSPLLITDFLYRARDLFAAKTITQYQDGEKIFSYTYAEYADRVLRLAQALIDLGVRPGDRVATLAWNHHRHLELYLAAPLAGAVLHTLNLRLAADEIAYIVDHADDRVVFVDSSLLPLLDSVRSRRPEMPVITTDGDSPNHDELIAAATPLEKPVPRDENDLAALCYTSGTTGAPKGVGYSHRALYLHTFAACLADGHAICERDTVCHVVPMFHANAWGIPFAALMTGANQVLPGPHPSVADIATMLSTEQVTYTGMVPTVAVDLVKHATANRIDLTSLRALVLGGSTPTPELIRSIEEDLGVPAYQGWGMTELSPMGTFARPPRDADDDPQRRYEYVRRQGRLLPGLHWKLVDDDGNEVPHNGVDRGELLMRGPWVADRYFRDEHPEAFADGWLRTGDIATIDSEGYLTIVDRAKDLIKSGGEWISSLALEQAPTTIPQVAEAAVIAVPHERWQERPLAFVVAAEGAQLVLASLVVSVSSWVSGDAFGDWGWRIPFLASVVIVLVGLYIRRGLAESRDFVTTKAKDDVTKVPVAEVLRTDWRSVLIGAGLAAANNALYYVIATYTLAYVTDSLKVPESQTLNHLTIVSVCYLISIPVFGWLSDRVGLRRQVTLAALAAAAFTFPYFAMIETGDSWIILLGMILGLAVIQSAAYAPQPAIYCELFPTKIRYTGASLAYALPTTLVGGTTPFIATWLYSETDSNTAMAWYIVGLCLVAAGCAWLAHRRHVRVTQAAAEPAGGVHV